MSTHAFCRMAVEKSPVEAGIVRAKNARQKRVIKNQAPKVVENNKSTIFIKGGNVSDAITMVFKDLHALKVPTLNSVVQIEKSLGIFKIFLLIICSQQFPNCYFSLFSAAKQYHVQEEKYRASF